MRRRLVLALVAVVATLPSRSVAQNDPALAARIAAIIDRPEFRHALWGIEIYDADANRPLYVLNEDKLLRLARPRSCCQPARRSRNWGRRIASRQRSFVPA